MDTAILDIQKNVEKQLEKEWPSYVTRFLMKFNEMKKESGGINGVCDRTYCFYEYLHLKAYIHKNKYKNPIGTGYGVQIFETLKFLKTKYTNAPKCNLCSMCTDEREFSKVGNEEFYKILNKQPLFYQARD